MCGVVGLVGKSLVKNLILGGLACLEYRGYDSTGFACLDKSTKQLVSVKVVGSLDNLLNKLKPTQVDGFIGIGHTRWATHGATNLANAHPHLDCKKQIAVVHNGIIENHLTLRKALEQQGHSFNSASDSEVIAHLAEEHAKKVTEPVEILKHISASLDGSYAYALLMEQFSDQLFVGRHRAPLCLGIGPEGIFVASDPLAFGKNVDELIFLPDKSFAIFDKEQFKIFDFNGNPLEVKSEPAINHVVLSDKGDYAHFMLKEIYEQKQAIFRTIYSYRVGGTIEEYLGLSFKQIESLDEIILIGCGTSWHAGLIGKFFFESLAHIPTRVELASEFRHTKFLPRKNTLCIAISQSGETADTLEAIALIKKQNIPIVALSNVAFSSLVRESSGLLLTEAGPEVAVASTKAFSTQVASLYWAARQLAYKKGVIAHDELLKTERELVVTAEALEENIEQWKEAILLDIDLYRSFRNYVFLGRHVMYPFALEAALKLKEISYIFSDAYPAGELKHGPLALIDKDVPVVLFSHGDPVIYQKLLTNAQAVKARGGFLIVFACKGQKELLDLADRVFELKEVSPLLAPLAMAGVMQYFCYALAKAHGRSIDKPRNLAKSVTVE